MKSEEIIARAKAIRARLVNPPNAWVPPKPIAPPAPPAPPPALVPCIFTTGEAIDAILRFVSARCLVSVSDILGQSRLGHIVIARQLVAYLAMRHLFISQSSLSRVLGRDHTTIKAGERRIASLLKRNAPISLHIQAIEEAFVAHLKPKFALPGKHQQNLALQSGEGPQVGGIPPLAGGSGSRLDGATQ